MEMNVKQGIASGALALALLGGSGASVAAEHRENVSQGGGAAGLVAAVVNANDVVDIRVVDSFNNLRALNNILNNSPILSHNDIDISDVTVLSGNDIDADVLNITVGDVTVQDVLNDLSIEVDDVVAVVQLLSGGVVVVV